MRMANNLTCGFCFPGGSIWIGDLICTSCANGATERPRKGLTMNDTSCIRRMFALSHLSLDITMAKSKTNILSAILSVTICSLRYFVTEVCFWGCDWWKIIFAWWPRRLELDGPWWPRSVTNLYDTWGRGVIIYCIGIRLCVGAIYLFYYNVIKMRVQSTTVLPYRGVFCLAFFVQSLMFAWFKIRVINLVSLC